MVLYGYSQGELSGERAEQLIRELQRDTNLYLSAPLVERAIALVEADEAGW